MSKSAFYEKFIKNGQKGFSLKGGYHAKWRLPANQSFYRRRLDAGPETVRPRSIWSNWNYDSEIYALGKRLNENFNSSLIRQAFILPSYAESQKTKLKTIGVKFDVKQNNTELATKGENICRNYLKAVISFWYPKLPQEGVISIIDYLLNRKMLANIVKNIGASDLVQTEEFPIFDKTLETCFYAIVGVLSQEQDKVHSFIYDFVLIQLIGRDINEIWKIQNPMGLLLKELRNQGYKSLPVSRLIWSTGATHPTGAFIVGIYINKKFMSKGSGESVEIAEEMAARDALRRIYGICEESAPIPYGEKVKKYSILINKNYKTISNC